MTIEVRKQPLVLWAGPINEQQTPDATIDGARRFFFVCTGDGSIPPRCSDFVTSQGGSILNGILSRLNLRSEDVGDIYLGAFSAGGQLWKPLLLNEADRSRIKGIMMHDAAYEIGSPQSPKFSEGFVRFGLDAARDPSKFMLMTGSFSPNVPRPGEVYQSGADTVRATADEIERRLGASIGSSDNWPSSVARPTTIRGNGKNLFVAEYQDRGHGAMAGDAGGLWKQALQPWVSSGGGSSGSFPDSETSDTISFVASVAVMSAGAAVGYVAAKYYGV